MRHPSNYLISLDRAKNQLPLTWKQIIYVETTYPARNWLRDMDKQWQY